MTARLRGHLDDECGAVSADWVMLTAMLIGLVLLAFAAYEQSAVGLIDGSFEAVGELQDSIAGTDG